MSQAQTDTDIKDTGVTVEPEDVINDILPFCAQGQTGRDLLSQADYTDDMQRKIGHQPGIARSQLANKQARQSAHMAAGLAQFLARRYAPGVVDDGDLDKVEAALVAAMDAIINSPAHLATLLKAGLVQPDGKTITVDDAGLLSALGGNLLLNDEIWITASGTWIAPVTGWYDLWMIGGGSGVIKIADGELIPGASGAEIDTLIYLEEGQEVPVIIGAGGLATQSDTAASGGATSFGAITTADSLKFLSGSSSRDSTVSGKLICHACGGGYGGELLGYNSVYYGAGGGGFVGPDLIRLANGVAGAVRLRVHNPAKAAGPLPAPALFAARRMARAAKTAVVNLYDPETGHGSVWREEDAPTKLAEGLITEAAWREICAQKAAEARTAWLADPDTGAERLALLRAARDAKLAATDYLVAPDYPITEAQRAAIITYRQALRDLPAQEGAPWDGGGDLTPWPEMPALTDADDA